jgi:transposase InsO family protein
MAVVARGGKQREAFHSDRGSTYTAHTFTTLCDKLDIRRPDWVVDFYNRRRRHSFLEESSTIRWEAHGELRAWSVWMRSV